MFTGCPPVRLRGLLPYLDPDTRVASFPLGKGRTYLPGSFDADVGGEFFDILEFVIQGELNHGGDQRLGSGNFLMTAAAPLAVGAVMGAGIPAWTEFHFSASQGNIRASSSADSRYSSA